MDEIRNGEYVHKRFGLIVIVVAVSDGWVYCRDRASGRPSGIPIETFRNLFTVVP